MGRHNTHGSIRKKKVKRSAFPQIYIDKDMDFASIKLSPGIEARSYVKNGFAFCEDRLGRVIEVQILNLSRLKRDHVRSAA